MGQRDYSQRPVVDKLGLKPGHDVLLDPGPLTLDPDFIAEVAGRCGDALPSQSSIFDVALIGIRSGTDPAHVLACAKAHMRPAGCIWLLTPKRGVDGYISQDAELIPAGAMARLVDNKICSISETISAMRFVLRKVDRASHSPVLGG